MVEFKCLLVRLIYDATCCEGGNEAVFAGLKSWMSLNETCYGVNIVDVIPEDVFERTCSTLVLYIESLLKPGRMRSSCSASGIIRLHYNVVLQVEKLLDGGGTTFWKK
jgi:hypothetical protein